MYNLTAMERVMPHNYTNLFLILLLCIATCKVVVSENNEENGICPFRRVSYSKNSCDENDVIEGVAGISTLKVISSTNDVNSVVFGSDKSEDCQYASRSLYNVFCNSETNEVMLDPCVNLGYSSQKLTYAFDACYGPDEDEYYFTISGNCTLVPLSTCEDYPEAPSIPSLPRPTASPTRETTADEIELPSEVPLPPNPFGDQFLSPETGHEAVFLSKLAYSITSDEVAMDLLPDHYNFHLFRDTGSTEVFIVSTNHTEDSQGKIFVVFRGTDTTLDTDYLVDIQSRKVNYGPPGKVIRATVETKTFSGDTRIRELQVHEGFNSVFSDDLYETIMSVVEPLLGLPAEVGQGLYYNSTINWYGHSLGGANAQIMGTYFAHFHPDVSTYIVTLGGPRVGNYAFKIFAETRANLNTWRMVNCRDVVPRVPAFQYYHAGHLMWKRCDQPPARVEDFYTEAYYRESGDFEVYEKLPLDFVVKTYEPTFIDDHFGANYLEWLEGALVFGGKYWTDHFQTFDEESETEEI